MSLLRLKIVACLDLLAVGLLIPVLSSHIRELGGNHITVGLFQSIYAGCQMISAPILGSLSDMKGCKKMLFWTLVICSGIYLVMGLTTSVYVIILTRAALGVFKQTQSLTKALVPEYVDRELSSVYGEMSAYTGAGVTIGPFIGGQVMDKHPRHGFAMLSVAVSLIFLMNAALIHHMKPAPVKHAVPRRRSIDRCARQQPRRQNSFLSVVSCSLKQSINHLYAIDWSTYWDVLIIKGLIGFAMSNYYANYTFYLRKAFRLNKKQVGYLISFQSIVGSLSSYFMGSINEFYPDDIDYSLRLTHIFIMITFALVGLFISWNVYLYTFFLIPLSAGNAMGRCLSLEMILTRCQGRDRAALIGVSNSIKSLAGVIAPMNAGFIASSLGISYVIHASIASAVLGMFLCVYQRIKVMTDIEDETYIQGPSPEATQSPDCDASTSTYRKM